MNMPVQPKRNVRAANQFSTAARLFIEAEQQLLRARAGYPRGDGLRLARKAQDELASLQRKVSRMIDEFMR